MVGILLVVVGCYALVAALVHLTYWLKRDRVRVSKHYVLVAHNQHMRMEWLVRSFYAFSRRMGTDAKLTVVDASSMEQTAEIVDRLEQGGGSVFVHGGKVEEDGDQRAENLNDRKRSQGEDESHSRLLWRLRTDGVVTSSEHAILVDLQNPDDLSKMPF
ncbi:hypothetical protein [Paenibacillus radicis (ex Gao et al. 2016)]|uniref:Uncharacterized protein n=1 Tax=Paenibacillus radicis (ex Gao et al. 2016) TaxID=1737354 RepID=A0A917M8N5_9BACL|nr:hypothetical protein [Paenibacillus radicis (ex Gao et al. 2016)]GGG84379.1 hypothetical protein GCM10010918_47780 [Paenibacillus radicis (ex Gao et al. 2016)]